MCINGRDWVQAEFTPSNLNNPAVYQGFMEETTVHEDWICENVLFN